MPSELHVTFNLFKHHSCAKSWCCKLLKDCAGSKVSGSLNSREVIIWPLGPKLPDYFVPALQVTGVLTVPQWNKTVGDVVVTVNEREGHFRACETHRKVSLFQSFSLVGFIGNVPSGPWSYKDFHKIFEERVESHSKT